MAVAGIEIGAHTLNHPRLPLLDDESLRQEVSLCRARIEQKIEQKVESFCYPNGVAGDYDQRVAACVRDAGFSSAVVAHYDGRPGHPFALRRHGAGSSWFEFQKVVYGVNQLFRRIKPETHGELL